LGSPIATPPTSYRPLLATSPAPRYRGCTMASFWIQVFVLASHALVSLLMKPFTTPPATITWPLSTPDTPAHRLSGRSAMAPSSQVSVVVWYTYVLRLATLPVVRPPIT